MKVLVVTVSSILNKIWSQKGDLSLYSQKGKIVMLELFILF